MNSRPKNILALIPARGGSKGVPKKNISLLGGRPLIAYTIDDALRSGVFDRIVVSTDDEEIAAISREYGAEAPFMRPKELARDTSVLGSVLQHALHALRSRGYRPDIYMILYPTSPFRHPDLLPLLAGKLQQGHSRAITVKQVASNSLRYCTMREGRLAGITPPTASSDAGYYRQCGIAHGAHLGHAGPDYVHLVTNPLELIDIDRPEDMALAERAIRCNLAPLRQ